MYNFFLSFRFICVAPRLQCQLPVHKNDFTIWNDKMQPKKVLGERVCGLIKEKNEPRPTDRRMNERTGEQKNQRMNKRALFLPARTFRSSANEQSISLIIGLNGVHYSPFTIMNILSTHSHTQTQMIKQTYSLRCL